MSEFSSMTIDATIQYGIIIYRSVPIHGFHDDYAFLVKGLLDLYEANFDIYWLEFAEILQDIQDDLFWDSQNGGYFSTVEDSEMILRMKDGTPRWPLLR